MSVEVKLTDELKKKLAGSLGFDIKAEFKYIPLAFRSQDIPQQYRAMFTLTGKDGLDIANIEDTIGTMAVDETGNRVMNITSGKQRTKVLEAGIVAVKNFPLANGDIVSFDRSTGKLCIGNTEQSNKTVNDLIRFIPAGLQVELQNAINEQLFVTEEELRSFGY